MSTWGGDKEDDEVLAALRKALKEQRDAARIEKAGKSRKVKKALRKQARKAGKRGGR